MPVTVLQPTYIQQTSFVCDRCGKTKLVETPVVSTGTEVQLTGAEAIVDLSSETHVDLPEGWDQANHPEEDRLVIFNTRSCMSAWFAQWIRVRYGGPEELPKRKTKPRRRPKLPPQERPPADASTGLLSQ